MSDLSDIKQREKRASDEIARLTEGNPGTNWRWSIPANPERDSDLILADSIADVPKLVAALEAVVAEHRKVSIYDECECPEGTHPEDYDYVDCQDYAGCENSITGIGCEECCVHGDYLTEACGESHNHTMDATQRCATVKAITEALA